MDYLWYLIRDDVKEINGLFYDAKKSAEILQKNSDKYISWIILINKFHYMYICKIFPVKFYLT